MNLYVYSFHTYLWHIIEIKEDLNKWAAILVH